MCYKCEALWEHRTVQLNAKICEFQVLFAKYKSYRQITINTLHGFCVDLIEHRRNVNIATVTGCSTSIVGGVMTGVGLVLTPFTLGASNVLTVAGIALGVAGSATTIGSKVTESVIEYKKKCELETHLRIDDSVGKQVDESLDEIHQEFESLKKLTSTTCARWAIMDWLTSLNRTRQFGQLSATTVSLVKKIIRLGSNGIGKAAVTSGDDILSNMVSLATRGALQGAKAGLAVGLGIASIGAIVDVVVMGYTIQQMRKGTESDSVKKLREIVRTLETSLEDFEYSYKDLLP